MRFIIYYLFIIVIILTCGKYDRACLQLSETEINELLKSNTPHTIRLKVPHGSPDILVKDISLITNYHG